MKLFNNTDNLMWRKVFTRLMLIVATVAVIVWFLPRTAQQLYHYDIGRPWVYSSMIANFDFPIYKTDEAIQQEQDSMLNLFQPYYNYDPTVERKQVERFLNDFKEGIPGTTADYRGVIVKRLHELYVMGIMHTPQYNELAKDTTNMVRVVNGKNAQSIGITSLLSTLSAYELLLADDRLSTQRQTLQKCNLNDYIEPNVIYDASRSETEKAELLSGISPASGMIMSGQKIIDRGEMVDEYTYRVLNSFERELIRRDTTSRQITTTIVGQVIFVFIMIVLFTLYLSLFRNDYFEKPRSIMMLYSLLITYPVAVSLMITHSIMTVYIIPFAIAPIFIRMFMDSRTAFISHAIIILICAVAVKYQYEFIIVQLVAGLVAIYSLRDLNNRAQVLKTALLVAVASILTYISLQLMQDSESITWDSNIYRHILINGVLLLLAYPLMYLVEKLFGFTSNVTMFELSNTNRGLLRDLSEIAPGTFQHSITVGNLAAEIANKIGANSLLVRTGALYHDIGKMSNPVFFTENQVGVNPHDNMSYVDSARMIISHVTEGIKMAEQNNLPTILKEFILTHHGAGMAKYFYIKQQNENPDEEVDKEAFSYPGPNPFTREQAILMMSDAVEAASRSLPEYTAKSIGGLVNKIIDSQVEEGYFRECPITFRDIAQAKLVLIDRLKSIYHTRISYPESEKK